MDNDQKSEPAEIASAAGAAAFLRPAFKAGDQAAIVLAIGEVAKVKGMSSLARSAGVSRKALYDALGPGGNPTLSTFLSILRELGLQLQVVPARRSRRRAVSQPRREP